jgi:outer membrane protein assembly factor BamA
MRKILLYLFLLFPLLSYSQKKEKTKEENKKVNYAFIPLIMYNSSLGAQFGLMTSAYFKMNSNDSISPASTVGFSGSYFTSKSFFTILFSRMYLDEDKWRTKTAVGMASINFQTYVDIPYLPNYSGSGDDDGVFLDYNSKFLFVYIEGTRRVRNHLYLGAKALFSSSTTTFDNDSIPVESESLLGIGIAGEYDDRDNVFYPHKGQNVKLGTISFLDELGSTSEYSKINIQYNKYFKITDNMVIMGRAYAIASTGDNVPFSGQNVVSKDDMRGYSNGKFRANQVYDLQTELRWNFYKRWGMVAFGGVAVATDNFSGDNFSGLLPAIGVGARFMAIESKKINIGIDIAKGIGDWGLYFRIGETFTK